MRPSYKWFPTNLPDRIIWFNNFATQFAKNAASLGMADKVQQVTDDNTVMQFIGNAEANAEAFREGIRQYRRIITEEAPGEPTPDFPGNPTLALPKVVTTGIFTRLDKLVAQIREADAYTDEIGALLGILPKGADSISPDEKKPALEGAAMPAQIIKVEFVRGDSDGINLRMRVDDGEWTDKGNFIKSPAEVTVTGDAAKAHTVELQARYLDGNEPVGQNSDTITLASQP